MNMTLLSAGSQEKPVVLPEAHNDFLWAFIGSPWGLLTCWLILINVIAFFVFGLDKWKAKRKEKKESVRRIPEKNLLLLAAAGGSVGALLGMKVFHHKTLHEKFRFGIPLILALQVTISFGLWLHFHTI